MAACKEEEPPSGESFARILVEPYVPNIERINKSVVEVRKQQERVLQIVTEAKEELKWCDLGGSQSMDLKATMDLVPHYAQKAQQCAKDMQALRLRVAKAKERAIRMAQATEKRTAKKAKAQAKAQS